MIATRQRRLTDLTNDYDTRPGAKLLREQGIAATEPQVGNAMWVTELWDPDGYRLLFESATDVPEETKLSQLPKPVLQEAGAHRRMPP